MLRDPVRLLPVALLAVSVAAQDAPTWWAYRPLERPSLPHVVDAGWVRSPIDAFVLAGLAAKRLAPAPPAERHALLRRVTYDLTGLPPTGAEIEAFVADAAPDAYERVVERLLASPQYGVKWAQHWLDLVRYAETDGYERDSAKPFVWRYRDWVVDALNADMPYGEFVTKQLAGDEQSGATIADQIATGYYRLGIWDDEPTDVEQHRYDVLDGIADTTARATLAISMGCARCHDHKKDPLPTRDYYAFLACFENIRPYTKQPEIVSADGAREQFEGAMREWRTATGAVQQLLQSRAQALSAAAPRVAVDDSLVASYCGSGLTATQLRDQTQAARHGQVSGQVVQCDDRGAFAMRFDGDDAIVLPRCVEGSFTVSFRVRHGHDERGGGADRPWFEGMGLVDADVPGVADDWGIAWLDGGVIAAGVGNPDTTVHSPPGYDDGEWHDVAFTRAQDTGRIALYVDDRLVDETTASRRPLDAPPQLHVGESAAGGRFFRGELNALRFHARALSQVEVVAVGLGRAPAEAAALVDADLLARVNALAKPRLATMEVLAVRERGADAPRSCVRLRGSVHSEGPEVAPGVPAMLAGVAPPFGAIAPTARSTGRRTALARWIASPANGLTWRVLANRTWQHHFGRGIVRSSDDFGRLGELPTHPELLDWLACEVLARGQSLKAMHRLIVTSQTYRMASRFDERAFAVDPQNDALWRFDRRRLTAEEVRDSMLAVDGTLNLARGGPSVYPPMPAAVLATSSRPGEAWGSSSPEDAVRRSLYVHVKRSLPEPLLAAFDRADTDASCPVRFATVQPTQALTMLNGAFAQQCARSFAARLEREANGLAAQLARGLELITQAPAHPDDVERLRALAVDLQRDFGKGEADALQRCCLVMLNCNAFLFLD